MYQSGFKVNLITNAINRHCSWSHYFRYKFGEKLQKTLEAIEKDMLVKSDEDCVKANISDSIKKIKAKIRLKVIGLSSSV